MYRETGVSSTWQDEPDQRETKAGKRRLRKRMGARRSSLMLPAVVMSVLGVSFVIWFLIGAPQAGGALGQANATAVVRAPVQPPQIASAPALAEPRAQEPAPIKAAVAPAEASQPNTAAILPLALTPTRQVSTPFAMTPVASEAEQIVAPRLAAPTPAERKPPAPTIVAPATLAVASPAPPPPKPAPRAEVKPESRIEVKPEAIPAPRTVAAAQAVPVDTDKPARADGFTIILASVETEGEARTKLGQFKQKYGSQLSGRRLNYHRTKQDGAIVWHVRSTGMSEEDAEAICEQIEKAGGECSAMPQ
jgi:hypothetical protein